MRLLAALSTLLFLIPASAAERPNVIFFAVDDLCDWVGAMGYEQAVTPNIDHLARRGVTFTNAHCPGTFCAPSRSAIFTGQFASTTGCYTTQVYFHEHPELQPLQVSFANAGYETFGAGKLFHHPAGYIDSRGWTEFFLRNESAKRAGWPLDSWGRGTPIPQPFPHSIYNRGQQITGGLFLEWGAVPNEREEEMADSQRVNWACEVLKRRHDKPFFLGVGLYAPHFPNYAPQRYFDLYDAAKITAPVYKDDDLEDLPPKIRRNKTNRKRKHHERLVKLDAVEQAIHGYLASVSYADAMLGRVLQALRESDYADNTIVVFWSDHGYHHGEKGDWGKHTLWERTSNVPFIWAGPGVKPNSQTDATVSLIDMYPTFVEVCGLPAVEGLEGKSLAITLREPAATADRDVYLPYLDPGGYAIINQRWRYIHYSDDTEELYDVQRDPHEWNNLANDSTLDAVKQKLRSSAPRAFSPPGMPKNELRLVTAGDTFHWEPKKRNPGNRQRKRAKVNGLRQADETHGRQNTNKQPASVDPSSLDGKVMVGYQGWFNCQGDGADLGWKHWARNRGQNFGPRNVTVDLWPDVTELDPDERYATDFQHTDGSVAEVFSSANRKTVMRHFRWMREYGIDGAFLQRFAVGISGGASLRNNNAVLSHAREGASESGRAFAVMYDLSGLRAGQVDRVREDWSTLRSQLKVTEDTTYLHYNGNPLVAVWGIGFNDGRNYSVRECSDLVKWLKSTGCAVMLGVPSFWREQTRDAVDDPLLHEIIKQADVVSPWSVGRYRSPQEAARHASKTWAADHRWCAREDIEFLPVVFPGFSWHNLHGGKLNQISRRKGEFFWSQIAAAKEIGCHMIYVAMFDEVDEATAIFKCTNDPPTGNGGQFITYDGLPSDHYLKLTGKAGQLLKDEIAVGDSKAPASKSSKSPSEIKTRPNVLFIVCDDLNTHVSTSGYPHIKTPAFDHLAATGRIFRRAYCQYPVCGPSRASFLHGLYPQSTGVVDNKSDIRQTRPGTVSMPQRFKESGYWTGAVGKVFHNPKIDPGQVAWHRNLRFENDEMPFVTPIRKKFEAKHGSIATGKVRRRWREFYPTIAKQTRGQQPGYGASGLTDEQHKDGRNARQIAKWLTEESHGVKPFFMACGIQKPHVPFLAPDKYFDMYPQVSLFLKPASIEFWKQAPKLARTKRFEGFGFEFGVENDKLRREYVQAYHACISFIDAQIGLVFDALKQSGHWDDTIVVLTSDHGYMLGEKFMWGKVMLFENCDRVPLIVRVPGQTEPGATTEGLVELVDLFPTLMELCNVTPPDNLQGRSLVPMLHDPTKEVKEFAYTVVSRGDNLGKAVRTKRWRYTKWAVGEELYDLQNDLSEETNLVGRESHRGTLNAMRSLLKSTDESAAAARNNLR